MDSVQLTNEELEEGEQAKSTSFSLYLEVLFDGEKSPPLEVQTQTEPPTAKEEEKKEEEEGILLSCEEKIPELFVIQEKEKKKKKKNTRAKLKPQLQATTTKKDQDQDPDFEDTIVLDVDVDVDVDLNADTHTNSRLDEKEEEEEKAHSTKPVPPKFPPPLSLHIREEKNNQWVDPLPPPPLPISLLPKSPAESKKEEMRERVRSKKSVHNFFWFCFYFHLIVNFSFFTFSVIVLCDETSNEFPEPCRDIRTRVLLPFGVILFLTYCGGRMQAIRKLAKAYRQKVEYSLPQFLWRPHVLVATFIPEIIPIAFAGYLYYVSTLECHEFYENRFPGMLYFTFFYFYITGVSWSFFLFASFWNMKLLNPIYRFWTIQKSFVLNPGHLLVRLDQISKSLQPLVD